MSHLEDIVEQTGYILEKDSEYSQKILEEEEEVSVSITQKGGKTAQHQVTCALCSSNTLCSSGVLCICICNPLVSVPGGDSEGLLRLGPGSRS